MAWIMALDALLGIKLQYSIDYLIADNKYFRVKGQWICHWGIVVNDFLSLAYCVPGFAWSFSILSISQDRPGRSADKPTGLQTCSETISSSSAPLGEEPEPLQPLGHTSDKWDWAEEEVGWSGGLRDMERRDFPPIYCWCLNKLVFKINCINVLFFSSNQSQEYFCWGQIRLWSTKSFWKCRNLLLQKL